MNRTLDEICTQSSGRGTLIYRIPPQKQLCCLPTKAERFNELHTDWERLARAEARWRGRFPALESDAFAHRRAAENRLSRLATADPAILLQGLPSSVGELDRARRVELRRRDPAARIEGCGLSSVVPVLTAPGGLAAARIALAWLDATANAALPPSLADVLVRSVDEVEHARSQAAACVDLERQIRERAQRLGEHVGLTGLQLEDVHKLLAQLDALLEAGSQLKEVIELAHQRRRLEPAGPRPYARRHPAGARPGGRDPSEGRSRLPERTVVRAPAPLRSRSARRSACTSAA